MRLFDAHCHLEDTVFYDDLPALLTDAKNIGVVSFLTCSTKMSEWPRSRDLSQRFDGVFHACGVHPWFSGQESLAVIEQELPHALDNASALGEIGLDGKITSPTINEQIPFLEVQLSLASRLKLPVILHCRSAFSELYAALKRNGPLPSGGIIHSFNGSIEEAKKFSNLGISFSLGGILTRKAGRKRIDMLNYIYPELIHLESDAPAMMPIGCSGSHNLPGNIIYNLRAGAMLLNIPPEQLAETAYVNSKQLLLQEAA